MEIENFVVHKWLPLITDFNTNSRMNTTILLGTHNTHILSKKDVQKLIKNTILKYPLDSIYFTVGTWIKIVEICSSV